MILAVRVIPQNDPPHRASPVPSTRAFDRYVQPVVDRHGAGTAPARRDSPRRSGTGRDLGSADLPDGPAGPKASAQRTRRADGWGDRGHWPLAGAGAFSSLVVAIGRVGDVDQAGFELALGGLVVAYTFAQREGGRRAWLGGGMLFVGFLGWSRLTHAAGDQPDDLVVPLLLLGAAWYVGREVRHHQQRSDSAAAASVAEERSRIARELHDVVAHGVSVMGLQASSALASLPPDRVEERASMQAIESLGRATLEDLHRMLGMLRPGTEQAPTEPLPRLAQLANLCATASTLPAVSLSVEGERRELSPGVELSAYRIVQEGLTNVRRHANAHHAWVRVGYLPGALEIEVRDDGGGSAAPICFGHGLVGIRERVALHGGSLAVDAGEPGFRLRILLPTGGDS